MNYIITDKMIEECKFVKVNEHAFYNAYVSIESELYKQKYGTYPDVMDIWDMDNDIQIEAKKIGDTIFTQLK